MYREITPERQERVREVYAAFLPMRETLRTEEALRLLVAAECSESPMNVDRVLDNMCKGSVNWHSDGIFHTWPAEKVHRIL